MMSLTAGLVRFCNRNPFALLVGGKLSIQKGNLQLACQLLDTCSWQAAADMQQGADQTDRMTHACLNSGYAQTCGHVDTRDVTLSCMLAVQTHHLQLKAQMNPLNNHMRQTQLVLLPNLAAEAGWSSLHLCSGDHAEHPHQPAQIVQLCFSQGAHIVSNCVHGWTCHEAENNAAVSLQQGHLIASSATFML